MRIKIFLLMLLLISPFFAQKFYITSPAYQTQIFDTTTETGTLLGASGDIVTRSDDDHYIITDASAKTFYEYDENGNHVANFTVSESIQACNKYNNKNYCSGLRHTQAVTSNPSQQTAQAPLFTYSSGGVLETTNTFVSDTTYYCPSSGNTEDGYIWFIPFKIDRNYIYKTMSIENEGAYYYDGLRVIKYDNGYIL